MEKMSLSSSLLKNNFKIQMFNYILASLITYGVVFLLLYFFVEIINLSYQKSYLLAYSFNYSFLYYVQKKYIFKTRHSKAKLIKFVLNIIVFFALSFLCYNFLLANDINYILSNFLTIILIFPLRFLSSKFIVFKTNKI